MLWVCAGCSTAYAVGLPACPHCRCADYQEDYHVAKNTRLGGASNASAGVASGGEAAPQAPVPDVPGVDPVDDAAGGPDPVGETAPAAPRRRRKT
jgi:hypothetical protein